MLSHGSAANVIAARFLFLGAGGRHRGVLAGFVAALICVVTASGALAVTYYVSPTGSDSNLGRQSRPFKERIGERIASITIQCDDCETPAALPLTGKEL